MKIEHSLQTANIQKFRYELLPNRVCDLIQNFAVNRIGVFIDFEKDFFLVGFRVFFENHVFAEEVRHF